MSRVRRQIDLASQRRYAELLSEFGGAFRRPWYNWLLRTRLLARRTSLAARMNPPDEIVAYLQAGLAAEGPDTSAWLKRITARTLVIGGARDQFFERRMAETADAIGGVQLHLLPNETHMAPVERAAEFRREIAAFLAGSANPMAGAADASRATSARQAGAATSPSPSTCQARTVASASGHRPGCWPRPRRWGHPPPPFARR